MHALLSWQIIAMLANPARKKITMHTLQYLTHCSSAWRNTIWRQRCCRADQSVAHREGGSKCNPSAGRTVCLCFCSSDPLLFGLGLLFLNLLRELRERVILLLFATRCPCCRGFLRDLRHGWPLQQRRGLLRRERRQGAPSAGARRARAACRHAGTRVPPRRVLRGVGHRHAVSKFRSRSRTFDSLLFLTPYYSYWVPLGTTMIVVHV